MSIVLTRRKPVLYISRAGRRILRPLTTGLQEGLSPGRLVLLRGMTTVKGQLPV